MLRLSSLLAVLGALTFAGCAPLSATAPPGATAPGGELSDFALIGRFSLRRDTRNYAGRLDWRHSPARDELVLSSPLGQAIAEIVSDHGGARMIDGSGNSYSANSAEELLQSVLGEQLPLDKLTDWLRGQGSGGGDIAADVFGRPRLLRDRDWRIDYEYDNDDPRALPARLFIERADGLQLRLRVEQWTMLPSDPPSR